MRPSAASRAKARAKRAEPGRAEWKTPVRGKCGACGKEQLCIRHHVVYEQHVRREGGDPWDQANAMLVGTRCRCHENHHGAVERIALARIPQTAIDFAIGLLGADRAALYIARYYRTDPKEGQ